MGRYRLSFIVTIVLCGIASANTEETMAAEVVDHPHLTDPDVMGGHGSKKCSYHNCINGYCYYGECVCSIGWNGPMCDQCIRLPGCVQGSCIKPYQCICYPEYYGPLCDHQDCGFIEEQDVSDEQHQSDSGQDFPPNL